MGLKGKRRVISFLWGYEGFRETWYKKKSNFSRSFVREIVRTSVYASPPLFPSLFLPLLFLHSRFSSLVLHRSFSHFSKEFVTTASSTDASLTLSLSMPLCSSWPYATRKPNLKITIEFRVCVLDRKRRRERARQKRRRWERFPRPCLICNMLHCWTFSLFFTRILIIFFQEFKIISHYLV